MAICLFPTLGLAQSSAGEAAKSRQQETTRAVQGATAVPAISESTVTFADVLANPSDPNVNLAYARRQISEGRIDLAAATLERILLQYPELHEVRLLYAVVLFRLDSLDEAYAELQLLSQRSLEPSVAEQVQKYLKQVEDARKTLKTFASVSLGAHADSNRNAYPDSGGFIIQNNRIKGSSESIGDIGWIGLGSAGFAYDTGDQKLQEINGQFTMLFDDQVEVDQLDLRAGIFDLGALYKEPFADFRPRLRYSYIELERRKYVADILGSLTVERRMFVPGFTGMFEVQLGHESFSNTRSVPLAREQNGRYYDLRLGGTYLLNPLTKLSGSIHRKDKNAKVDFEAYESYGVEMNVVRLLPNNTFISGDLTIDKQSYDTQDPFVSQTVRHDVDWSIGLTYGIPVGNVIKLVDEQEVVPEALKDVNLTLTGSYTRQDSNITNYEYKNWRGQILFTKNWNF